MEETNVIVPECAMDALTSIVRARGQSRDHTIRQLLEEHLHRQELRKPSDRLTHISTVLRYLAAPLGRKQPRIGARLRLRLPPGTTERARALSLMLPGQSLRARKDYQARQLTDAVVTAIATAAPFTDDFLDGLPPLLRHRAAIRLWQAAVAATCTTPEQALLNEAYEVRVLLPDKRSDADRRLLRIADALETDVAWHSPRRFEAAAELARAWLRGHAPFDGQTPLDQLDEEWGEQLQDLRNRRDDANSGYDWSGRGASAVWRARRMVEMDDFEQWLLKHRQPADAEVYRITPPGWLIRLPAGWCTRELPEPIEEPFATWLATGDLLRLSTHGRSALWPLRKAATPPGWEPVPGLKPVLMAARGLPSTKIASFIEAVLLAWDADDAEHLEALQPPLRIFVDKAVKFGFIDTNDVQAIRAEARRQTLQQMQAIVDHLPDEHAHLRPDLAAAIGSTRQFAALAENAGIKFQATRATWAWPLTAVADEAVSGQRADAVKWLAHVAHQTCSRQLQRSMEAAWRQAFDHSPKGVWLRERRANTSAELRVTPTNTPLLDVEFILDPEPPF
ncbi:hypothetical protein Q5425_31395 [Amycolatopsis sp. A133]|uniref:hypothetical protein n=1 Tax=Amycolatopsis sp. A133 TaxID=3064472 RepID=UPI0027FE5C09|nr:hypothetical protein [Amycolatopsis sp. A133]MDQ7808261.1 hypothetical protein [Amycolatopsis sp. A133]